MTDLMPYTAKALLALCFFSYFKTTITSSSCSSLLSAQQTFLFLLL